MKSTQTKCESSAKSPSACISARCWFALLLALLTAFTYGADLTSAVLKLVRTVPRAEEPIPLWVKASTDVIDLQTATLKEVP